MNSFGTIFRVSLFGESHGPAVGVLVDGCPPGLRLDAADFEADLARRRGGTAAGARPAAAGTTPRAEADVPEILSGLYQGRTTGTPILILFRNADTKDGDYEAFRSVPRPGHADLTGRQRYLGYADPRGGGHFSGRITVGLVAAGVIAKALLPGASFRTAILEAGGRKDVEAACEEARAAGDSVGALVEIRAGGVGAGLGEPFFGAVESRIAEALFAVPGVRGVEFGDGFRSAAMRGSEHNDPIVSPDGRTSKNGSGGVNGGITNGNEIVVRVAMKPTSTIALPQRTLDLGSGTGTVLEGKGRHDACIAIRGAVALEAAVAIALADLAILARNHDYAIGAHHDA
jgi:chorismate synthase